MSLNLIKRVIVIFSKIKFKGTPLLRNKNFVVWRFNSVQMFFLFICKYQRLWFHQLRYWKYEMKTKIGVNLVNKQFLLIVCDSSFKMNSTKTWILPLLKLCNRLDLPIQVSMTHKPKLNALPTLIRASNAKSEL